MYRMSLVLVTFCVMCLVLISPVLFTVDALAQTNPVAKPVIVKDSVQLVSLNKLALIDRLRALGAKLNDAETKLKRTPEWQEYVETLSTIRGIESILNDTTIVVR